MPRVVELRRKLSVAREKQMDTLVSDIFPKEHIDWVVIRHCTTDCFCTDLLSKDVRLIAQSFWEVSLNVEQDGIDCALNNFEYQFAGRKLFKFMSRTGVCIKKTLYRLRNIILSTDRNVHKINWLSCNGIFCVFDWKCYGTFVTRLRLHVFFIPFYPFTSILPLISLKRRCFLWVFLIFLRFFCFLYSVPVWRPVLSRSPNDLAFFFVL